VLSQAASKADVGFYALVVTDTTGVDLSDQAPPPPPGGGIVAPSRAEARRKEGNFLFDGAASAAIAAGGDAFHVIGTGDRFLARVLDETSSLYRLGVEMPLNVEASHLMAVRVTVKRSGVTLRTNTHALPPVPPKPMSTPEAMKLRLEQGGATFAVPMTLATTVKRDATSRMQVTLNLDVPSATPGPLSMMLGIVNAAGTIVQSGQKTLPVVANGDYRFAAPLTVEEGDYHLRVVIADANGNIGSIDQPVVARPRVVGPYTASDLLLSIAAADGTGRLLALDTVPRDATGLRAEFELYGATAEDKISTDLELTQADGSRIYMDDVMTSLEHDGRLTITEHIGSEHLLPGPYVVTVTVRRVGAPIGTLKAQFKKAAS
jgi:hypothetical protein